MISWYNRWYISRPYPCPCSCSCSSSSSSCSSCFLVLVLLLVLVYLVLLVLVLLLVILLKYVRDECDLWDTKFAKTKQQTVIIYGRLPRRPTGVFSQIDQASAKRVQRFSSHEVILSATSDGYQQFRQFHVPLLQHQIDEFVNIRVTLDTDVLNTDHKHKSQHAVFNTSEVKS